MVGVGFVHPALWIADQVRNDGPDRHSRVGGKDGAGGVASFHCYSTLLSC